MTAKPYCNAPDIDEAEADHSVIHKPLNAAAADHTVTLPVIPAAFINRLPSELLSLIFDLYINGSHMSELPKYRPGILPFDSPTLTEWHPKWADFMRIMNVCRKWHAIALNTPEFWSQVIFKGRASVQILEVMLARSKAAPLDIRVAVTQHKKVKAYLRSIDIRRIRVLHLSLKTHINAVRETFVKSGRQAELLQSMCVEMEALPLNIFSLSMPNLQHLDLRFHGSETQWAALHAASRFNLSRLISLRLVSQSSRIPNTKGHLYGILSAMPDLEILHLDGALQQKESIDPCDDFPRPEESGRMVLPNLHSCTIINSPVSRVADFHSTISYPAITAKIHLRLTQLMDDDGPLRLPALLDVLGLSEDNPRRSHHNLLISSSSLVTGWRTTWTAHGARFALWDGGLESFPSRTPTFSSEDPPVILESDNHPLTISLSRNLLISGLARAEIHYNTHLGLKKEEWHHLFARHPDIENMHIAAGSFITGIIDALDTPIEPLDGWQQEQPLIGQSEKELSSDSSSSPEVFPKLCLPNLMTLTIEDKPRLPLHGVPATLLPELKSKKDRIAYALVHCLFKRCNHNLQLQNLHFLFMVDWNVQILELLSEVVVSVTWAGYFHEAVPPYYKLNVGYGTDNGSENDSSYYPSSNSDDSGGDSEGSDEGVYGSSDSDLDEFDEEYGDDVFWG